jgi:hypothetical protein
MVYETDTRALIGYRLGHDFSTTVTDGVDLDAIRDTMAKRWTDQFGFAVRNPYVRSESASGCGGCSIYTSSSGGEASSCSSCSGCGGD